jgi:hypothetical protein
VSGPHQQPHAAQRILREVVQQRRQENPVSRIELDLLPVQLPFQHGDLMA